jgi:ATPase subunit of ABC transporter with duplicated ATPase domains
LIRLDQISKQHGPQILFVEASAAIYRGEKIGLCGPNGAGKSTIFRMIMKEESPDDGQVSVERGVSIGYFSQDVGGGPPCRAEAMAGRACRRRRRKHLEQALADPARARELGSLEPSTGRRARELGGYAPRPAREIPPASFPGDGGRRRRALRRLKTRVALRASCSCAPTPCS